MFIDTRFAKPVSSKLCMCCYSIPHTIDPEKIAQKIPVKDPVFNETADRLSKGQDLPDRWTVRCT
ncbi:MAG: hypothetical protein M0Z47_07310, partial [Actinomycetota bacterium]|nr:hypothetical protein [Actinomycetota bacterium]